MVSVALLFAARMKQNFNTFYVQMFLNFQMILLLSLLWTTRYSCLLKIIKNQRFCYFSCYTPLYVRVLLIKANFYCIFTIFAISHSTFCYQSRTFLLSAHAFVISHVLFVITHARNALI